MHHTVVNLNPQPQTDLIIWYNQIKIHNLNSTRNKIMLIQNTLTNNFTEVSNAQANTYTDKYFCVICTCNQKITKKTYKDRGDKTELNTKLCCSYSSVSKYNISFFNKDLKQSYSGVKIKLIMMPNVFPMVPWQSRQSSDDQQKRTLHCEHKKTSVQRAEHTFGCLTSSVSAI